MQVLKVSVDGSVTVEINASPTSGQMVIDAVAPPVDINVLGCPNATVYAVNTSIVVYAPNCSEITLRYLTLSATSKNGSTWILRVRTPYRTIVLLPSNAIPIDTEPTPTPVSFGGTWGLEFPPGELVVKYIEVPSSRPQALSSRATSVATHASSSGGGGIDSATAIGVTGAVLLGLAIALKLLRGRRTTSESKHVAMRVLDDVDRRIIEALRRYGQQTARELMERTGVPKSTLYRRLAKLRDLGVIESVTIGGATVYRLRSGLEKESGEERG
ncbi:MAG: winged helix-turn-helix transcriptional regulator [Crenarchaeota archaeon]|nr:winged helix-turn-helix transcriptional regulator [Thermoproteota archaeon]